MSEKKHIKRYSINTSNGIGLVTLMRIQARGYSEARGLG